MILDDDKNNGWTIEGGWAEEINNILRNSQVGGSTYPIFFACGALENKGCSTYPGVRLMEEIDFML